MVSLRSESPRPPGSGPAVGYPPGETKAERTKVRIAAGTRDEKMAFAGVAREKKMKRIVQGMRRPDPKVRSALEAWKAEGAQEAE